MISGWHASRHLDRCIPVYHYDGWSSRHYDQGHTLQITLVQYFACVLLVQLHIRCLYCVRYFEEETLYTNCTKIKGLASQGTKHVAQNFYDEI